MALTADRATQERKGVAYEYPMAASAKCFGGALTVLDASGNAKPGVAATGLVAVGRCEEYAYESTGVAAAKNVKVKPGIFKWANSAADPVTKANIGDTVYITDDQTVCATGTGKSAAGVMVDIESDGVWVKTEPPVGLGATGLLAANNLSDVGLAATARTNLGLGTIATQDADAVAIAGGEITGITDLAVADGGTGASTAAEARAALGANKVSLNVQAPNLVAADAKVYRVVSPVAGQIKKIHSVLEHHALATGDATITGTIGGVAITNGVVTIGEAGSAAGDVDSATPSVEADRTVAVGNVIELTVGGANTDTDAQARLSIDIET